MSEENSNEFEKQRLEIEKMKLEIEMKKLELEKEKTANETAKQFSTTPTSIEPNILAVIIGIISALTLFFPWVRGVASGSVSILGYSNSSNISSGALSGISTSEGQICFLLSVVGIFFNIKGKRIASLIGIICVILIVIFVARIKDIHSTVSGTGYSGSFEMKIYDEIGYSILSYLIYSILSFWNFIKSKSARSYLLSFFSALFFWGSVYFLIHEGAFLIFFVSSVVGFFAFRTYKFPFSKKYLLVVFAFALVNYFFSRVLSGDSEIVHYLKYELFNDNDLIVYFLMHSFGILFIVELIFKIRNKDFFETSSGLKFQKISLAVITIAFFLVPLCENLLKHQEEKQAASTAMDLAREDSIAAANYAASKAVEDTAVRAAQTMPSHDISIPDTANTNDTSSVTQEILSSGTKKYCNSDGTWYYVVIIEGSNVTLKSYAGDKNTSYQEKSLPKDIIKGEIVKGSVILTKNEDGEMTQLFKISKGILHETGYEGTENIYNECN